MPNKSDHARHRFETPRQTSTHILVKQQFSIQPKIYCQNNTLGVCHAQKGSSPILLRQQVYMRGAESTFPPLSFSQPIPMKIWNHHINGLCGFLPNHDRVAPLLKPPLTRWLPSGSGAPPPRWKPVAPPLGSSFRGPFSLASVTPSEGT